MRKVLPSPPQKKRKEKKKELGFSPYERLFGRTPFSDARLDLSSSGSSQTVQQYFHKFKDTLQSVRSLATENLRDQAEMKKPLDKGTKRRKFKPWNLILTYLLIPDFPIKTKFGDPTRYR